MVPICIATGNCMVLKAASFAPQSAMRITELWNEAGLPPGVLNIVTTSRNEAEILLKHPAIKGVSFVGSTSVGLHIYATAAANGKRVQSLTEAKNHALVLRDCRPRAHRPEHHQLLLRLRRRALHGPAGGRRRERDRRSSSSLGSKELAAGHQARAGLRQDRPSMGPVVNAGHKEFVLDWIEKAIQEGARAGARRAQPADPQRLPEGLLPRTDHLRSRHRRHVRRPRRNLRSGALHQAGREL